jgi:hypothetical protein
MNRIPLIFIISLVTCLSAPAVETPAREAGKSSYFPDDCWGVYSWGGWNITRVNRETHPLIKGAPMVFRWSEIEPQPGEFRFDEQIGRQLKEAEQNGFFTFLMIWVAPHAPRWLYENGVPEAKMTPNIDPLGKPRDWTFQYYLDDDYVRYYHRLLTHFGHYVKSLPPELRERILYIQSAEGSTGDGWGYKGEPLNPDYEITDDDWGRFRIQAWEVLKDALSDERGRMVTPILVNYDSNRDDQYHWVLNNLPVIGLKNGMFSHGYHISDTKERIRNWNEFTREVKAHGKEFFSRGEQDAEYQTYGWSTQNIAQGLYWSAIFATHCGLDMWNVPWEACQGYSNEDAIRFFNTYAGHHEASDSPAAFCALRQGLDASDTDAFPEAVYGRAEKKNIERYLTIAEAFKPYGAIQGDPEKATGGGMVNRKRQDYNDVGWGIHDRNYNRFISQIEPETSIGWWHRGPVSSVYSRFARSTDTDKERNTLYFDLDDNFIAQAKPLTVRVIWLDEGKTEWTFHYNAPGDANRIGFSMKNQNSGNWQEKLVVLNDFVPGNGGPKSADFFLKRISGEDLVVHLVEVRK